MRQENFYTCSSPCEQRDNNLKHTVHLELHNKWNKLLTNIMKHKKKEAVLTPRLLPSTRTTHCYTYRAHGQVICLNIYNIIQLMVRGFLCERFVTWLRSYGEEFLTSRPTPKLEHHPLSPVRDCLFNTFAATLHTGGRSSIRNLRARHTVVQGPTYHLRDLD